MTFDYKFARVGKASAHAPAASNNFYPFGRRGGGGAILPFEHSSSVSRRLSTRLRYWDGTISCTKYLCEIKTKRTARRFVGERDGGVGKGGGVGWAIEAEKRNGNGNGNGEWRMVGERYTHERLCNISCLKLR